MKISHKIILVIIASCMLSSLSISVIAVIKQTEHDRAGFDKKTAYLAEVTALSCQSRIWEVDTQGIADISRAVMREPSLYAFVIISEGNILSGAVREYHNELVLFNNVSELPLRKDRYDVIKSEKMIFRGSYLGEAKLYFSSKEIIENRNKAVCFILGASVFLSFVFTFILYYYTKKKVLWPLTVLGILNTALAARFKDLRTDLEHGVYDSSMIIDEPVPENMAYELYMYGKMKNEIGTLFRAFNIMKESILATTRVISRISSELKNMNERLESIVDMRTRLLRKSNSKLKMAIHRLKQTQATMVQQEKLASIGQIAAGVAHEINNPTGFIMSNLGSLSRYVDDICLIMNVYREAATRQNTDEMKIALENAERLAEKLDLDFLLSDIRDIITDSSEGSVRIKDIVDNLKNYARMDNAETTSPISINECLRSTIKLLGNELKYDIDVSVDFGDVPLVQGHSGQFAQVFTNIIVNASHSIKSMSREKRGSINVKTYEKDGSVWCEIEDDGSGIPENIRQKIFEPFFTTKEAGKGTGLGLSIAMDIIKTRHKGDIWCESSEGRGTTFIIRLPAIDEQ